MSNGSIIFDERLIRKTYNEIVAGYSLAVFQNEIIYIKHFKPLDLLEFDFRYQQKLASNIQRGIYSESEKISLLIRDGLWSEEQQRKIEDTKSTIENLYQTKRNFYSPSDIAGANKEIQDYSKYLMELMLKRASLVGDTAESLARKKIDVEQIIASFYKDPDFKNRFLSEEAARDVRSEDLNSLFKVYENFSQTLADDGIKRVSVSNDFQQMFSFTDNLYYFYGQPISQLSNYQIKLSLFGSHYKNILYGENRPPQDIKSDPEKLDDWFSARSSIQKILDKNDQEGRATSFMGISKKELQYLGIEVDDSSSKKIQKLAAEHGGELSIDQLKHYGIL